MNETEKFWTIERIKEWHEKDNRIAELQSQNAKLLQAVNDKDQELFEAQEVVLVAELLNAAPAMCSVISELLVELEHADPDWIGARLQSILDAGAEAIRKVTA